MANFEAFCWNISLSANLLFMKSEQSVCLSSLASFYAIFIAKYSTGYYCIQRSIELNLIFFRYYEDIHTLKNLPKSQFQPGSIGIQKLPRVILSRIPKAVDTTDTVKLNELVLQGVIMENVLCQEIIEKKVIEGIDDYFVTKTNEDVIILYNQHLDNPQEKNRQEKDLLLGSVDLLSHFTKVKCDFWT